MTELLTEVFGHRVLQVIEEWRVVDRWWAPDETIDREYVVADIDDGRRCVFMRENDGPWTFVTEEERTVAHLAPPDQAHVDSLRTAPIADEILDVTWGLWGVELAEWQAIQRLVNAGFVHPKVLTIMFAIIEGESGSYTKAWHANVARDSAGKIVRKTEDGAEYMQIKSIDLGFIQRNVNVTDEWVEIHKDAMRDYVENLFSLYPNLALASESAEIAFDLYSERGFQPWYAYKPTEHQFVLKKRRAARAIANMTNRLYVGRLEEDGGNFPILDYRDQT
jgi:hypothetical protein